jgi:hypothetical protein
LPLIESGVIIMSLSTLTFSSDRKTTSQTHGRIKILKTDKFFGTDECCIIGKLIDGAVSQDMSISGTDKKVVSVESHYGDACCSKKGAQVVLMVLGAEKEDYSNGEEIIFEKMLTQKALVKPKGKFIIA